jgi:hypothetical protein
VPPASVYVPEECSVIRQVVGFALVFGTWVKWILILIVLCESRIVSVPRLRTMVPPAVNAPVAIALAACELSEVSIKEKCSVFVLADAVAATVIPSAAIAAVVTARIVLRMLAVSLCGRVYCRLLVVVEVRVLSLRRVPLAGRSRRIAAVRSAVVVRGEDLLWTAR